MAISFTINGTAATVDAGNDTPLLWVVREQLKLTGTKFGCGSGLCGACTVHVDGKAVRACQTTLSSVAGRKRAMLRAGVITESKSASSERSSVLGRAAAG